jgi:hypothetical protein
MEVKDMKVTILNDVEVELNTHSELGILYWFLVSRYGTMYKQIMINDIYITRVETDPDAEISKCSIFRRDVDENGDEVLHDVEIEYKASEVAEELNNQTKDANLDYNKAGEYSALDFKGSLLTTLNIGDRSVTAKFPARVFTQADAKDSDKLYVDLNCCPDIVACGADEAAEDVFNYRLRFKQLERDIIYELDLVDPIYSVAMEV